MFKTHAHRTMDMTEGSLLTKVLFFRFQLCSPAFLQLLFQRGGYHRGRPVCGQ